MKATFENSVDVLVKAYLNDTLEHGNCYACAVGNLLTAAKGWTYTQCVSETLFGRPRRLALKENDGKYEGKHGGNWYTAIVVNSWLAQAKDDIDSIGYSFDEILKIEKAFEGVEKGMTEDEYMFNGLMAVVDVLADIHGVDLTTKEQAVGRFVEVQATK